MALDFERKCSVIIKRHNMLYYLYNSKSKLMNIGMYLHKTVKENDAK